MGSSADLPPDPYEREENVMPELPEVETIRRVLEPQITGLTITAVTVRRPEVVARPTAAEFCQILTGQTVSAMTRRGKFLGIRLSGGDHIVLHLRMTGCLLHAPIGYPEEKHTHVVFCLSNHTELRFSDPRRFGRFWLVRAGEADPYSGAGRLGPEPFDAKLTAGYLQQSFGRSKRAVKQCLLDQSVIAGIGNIYSDEILFAAQIHPARPAHSLTGEEWERLAAMIPALLGWFTDKNAVTPEEYLQSGGRDYRNTPFLRVYGHRGEPCPRCGASLERITVGGRSSVFCPLCQNRAEET